MRILLHLHLCAVHGQARVSVMYEFTLNFVTIDALNNYYTYKP
jgi:hypothetical protein